MICVVLVGELHEKNYTIGIYEEWVSCRHPVITSLPSSNECSFVCLFVHLFICFRFQPIPLIK
jgi:hypothetical protein